MSDRSTRDVLESHLALRRRHDLETDLARNYGEDVVVLSAEGVHHGHDALRMTAAILDHYAGDDEYDYHDLFVDADYGMLLWSAQRSDLEIHDGADSYVVRDGLIRMQSIHYSVRPS